MKFFEEKMCVLKLTSIAKPYQQEFMKFTILVERSVLVIIVCILSLSDRCPIVQKILKIPIIHVFPKVKSPCKWEGDEVGQELHPYVLKNKFR